MEKFHKYCLSVLLVIVCSNISANTNIESLKNIDCKQFNEIYSQFLKFECETSKEFYLKKKSTHSFAINYKQKAVDIFENFILRKQQNSFYNKNLISSFRGNKHCEILENFEKQNKEKDFAENIYFKSKVAKIRNKDDLDLKNKT
jgi:hypothetical protein